MGSESGVLSRAADGLSDGDVTSMSAGAFARSALPCRRAIVYTARTAGVGFAQCLPDQSQERLSECDPSNWR
jgi:hypothetical protein